MNSVSYRERLYDAFAEPGANVESQIDQALDIGGEYLGLPVGFFTQIDGGRQEIVRATGDHDLIQPGESCPLDEAYCRRTIEIDGALAIQDVAVSTINEAAIETFGLGTYIGAKVVVDDAVHGTVCFADHDQRDDPFSESEELFVELLARLVGSTLEQRAYERDLRAQNEQLRREKERFEGIAETSFDILFRVDDAARFSYVSAAVERVLDYHPDTLVGEPFTEFITDESARDAAVAYDQLLDGGAIETLELDFLDATGDIVTIEVNAAPITDNGTIEGVQGVGRDVTARKERERELRIKTRAIDDADIGITISDPTQPDEPLVYVNEGFERITGYDADNAVGRNCRFLQGKATDPDEVARFRSALENESSVTVELINYRQDGTPFWNRIQLTPIFDDCGDLNHYLGFQTDVTERRRTEQLIALLNRVLRHNLRNDMGKILGFANLITTGEAGSPQELAGRIERVADDLVSLSEHARTLESNARTDRDPRRLDPPTVLTRLADNHREAWPAASIDVTIATDRAICAGAELEAALSEAMTNAITHNPAAEPGVTVTVSDDGEWIVVEIADDGPGIDAMEAAVVAAGSETPLEHGSGLGLWLINWIVTRYGGSFDIDGDADGTTATIRLPAITPDDDIDDAARRPTVLFR
ncbi:PAS domain S-box protein [Halonotius terrestris]|uniref:PAS domain S-box protein n=1 Tax=Halonotius terrestris TaxID=2487750 RepID=A0A8J8TBI0_9EURY|nr:PAS domain S-box protein [Halonotius terrestris]TQQ80962.1 PAS domain S-box protein [Halonotius terrestris]